MKQVYLLIGCLCLAAFAVMPAQASAIKDLTITLAQNGDAQVDMHYELSFLEQSAVFLQIINPAGELERALEDNLERPVRVLEADSSSAEMIIPAFATVSQDDGAVMVTSPPLSFSKAQEAVNRYWFGPLLSPDFSPRITTIIFPDGYQTTYNDRISIPSVSHEIST